VSNELETLLLFYVSWHEGEFTLSEMRQSLLDELGEAGFLLALQHFSLARLERESRGDFRTYYELQK
jgi:hypothetical protein